MRHEDTKLHGISCTSEVYVDC